LLQDEHAARFCDLIKDSMPKRLPNFQVPGFGQNDVLQLIAASGTGFIAYHLARVSLIVFGFTGTSAMASVLPYAGLPPIADFPAHFWTLLTYGWVHNGFFEWVSNMVWLYCFGNALQMLVGYRQVIPLYIYGLLGGGAFCLLSQLLPSPAMAPNGIIITGQPGVMALLAALITLTPKYRFYIGENFSIPLLLVAAIYLLLTALAFRDPAHLMLNVGAALTGFLTMSAIKRGRHPGRWMYDLTGRLGNIGTPNEYAHSQRSDSRRNRIINNVPNSRTTAEKRVDEILDKINQRGYNSLSAEERELLLRASREAD
jgi:membrane associated rhomboid family serine protease